MAGVKAIFKDIKDVFKGDKKESHIPTLPVTEGTVFRPLWDKVIVKYFSSSN